MSSLRNAVPRKAHKERAQPASRRKFGLLEKHKDYVERAKAYHKKEQALQKLKEKALSRNPDEFYFKMINARTVDGVHKPKGEPNKYTSEELALMKTQDSSYIMLKLQSEKKKIESLSSVLHCTGNKLPNKHVYFAEDRDEARELRAKVSQSEENQTSDNLSEGVKRAMASSYRELEARKQRVKELEKIYSDMHLQRELQKKGKKRKLRPDEIVNPTTGPVYKWRQRRKR